MTPNHFFDLTNPANRAVYGYIKNLSVDPEVAEPLTTAIKPLGDVQVFIPDPGSCSYCAVSTKGIIFGFAIGRGIIVFRLDEKMKARAVATGGAAFPESGPEWVGFEPFRCDWPKIDFEFWARKAYCFVRENIP
jgi:hypothetical protein